MISKKGQKFLSDLEDALNNEWASLSKEILEEAERWYTQDAPFQAPEVIDTQRFGGQVLVEAKEYLDL